jgi:hypothetical protein
MHMKRQACLSGESDLLADSSDELDLWGTTQGLDFFFKPNLDIQSKRTYNASRVGLGLIAFTVAKPIPKMSTFQFSVNRRANDEE